jgi:rhodanese-related sulfurtransferase
MRYRHVAAVGIGLVLGILFLLSGIDASAQTDRMSKEELKSMLGKPELVVIDVRQPGDLAKNNLKIKGAVREDPRQEVKTWADKYQKDKIIVLYCA